MVQLPTVLEYTIILSTHLLASVSKLANSIIQVYYYGRCCITANDTILAAYSNGTHNPKCPSTYTNDAGSIVTLKCDLGATWRQSGSTGDASDHFEGLLVNPQDGCLVCLHVFVISTIYCICTGICRIFIQWSLFWSKKT